MKGKTIYLSEKEIKIIIESMEVLTVNYCQSKSEEFIKIGLNYGPDIQNIERKLKNE